MDWEQIHTQATTWMKDAGEKIKTSFQTSLDIQTKSNPNDLVTNMDHEIEAFLKGKITSEYPDHYILGEEGSGHDLASLNGIVWIIDPIDGTTNFVHQQRNFAISIGIVENGVGRVGIIYDVVHDEMYHCIKGQGAYMNDIRLELLPSVEVKDAIVGINSTWIVHNRQLEEVPLQQLVKDVRGTRSTGSAAIELAYVASGRLDAYLSMRLAPWDFAGGIILIEEVGGIATSVEGNKLHFLQKSSVLAGKPSVHHEIVNRYIKKKNIE